MLLTVEKLAWFRSVLQLNGSILPSILPRVLLFGGFGVLVSFSRHSDLPFDLTGLGHLTQNVACNLVLGLLLVFRTNTAYERFWEGRKAWGTIAVNIRNLSREIQIELAELTPTDRTEKEAALKCLAGLAIAIKLHLRHLPITHELDALISSEQISKIRCAPNPPLELALWVGHYIQQQYQYERIDTSQRWAMNTLLNSITEGLTSCERILRTPIPPAYAIYLRRLILIYCACLPFGLVEQLGWWTGLLVTIVSFVLLGIEEIGNEIEDPFGTDPNDLPLDEICQTILTNVESTIAFVPDDRFLPSQADEATASELLQRDRPASVSEPSSASS